MPAIVRPLVRWRSALLVLLLGFAVGAFVFLVLKGGLPGLPTSPFGGDNEERLSLSEEAASAERRLLVRYPQLRPKRRAGSEDQLTVRLWARDIRDLALAALARDPEGERLLQLVSELDVEINDGEVGFEIVIDFERMPRELLSEKERESVEKVEDWMPILGGELPISVWGRPEARGGKIRLGDRPRIEVSILKLSIETLSERLGVSVEELMDSLELEWPGYEVLEVLIEEGVLELVVRTA